MNKASFAWLASRQPCSAADISGKPGISASSASARRWGPAKLDLKVDGNKLTGTLNELKIEGTVARRHREVHRHAAEWREVGRLSRATHLRLPK